jgi:beta-glucanase (GH16 family)
MRARIDTRLGMWPAFWTVGVTGRWPHNGEIDIMEFYKSTLLANVAWGGAEPGKAIWADTRTPLASFGPGWSDQFHVWRMDWDAQQIVIYLDDQAMNTTTLASMLNPDGTSPFQQKAYMLMDLAIGGMNGGDPSATAFPQRYEVDYIRVFQKQ